MYQIIHCHHTSNNTTIKITREYISLLFNFIQYDIADHEMCLPKPLTSCWVSIQHCNTHFDYLNKKY